MTRHTCYGTLLSMAKLFPIRNNFLSRKDWEEACWRKLLKLSDTLDLITPATDRHSLIMRAVALDWLRAGMKFERIIKELQISRQTLSAVKKVLHENGYRSYRQRGKTERKKRVYTSNTLSHAKRVSVRRGKRVRTKYGNIHLP